MNGSSTTILVVFVLYTLGLFYISYISAKKIHSNKDYLIGGRKIGFLGSALSAAASSNSASAMIGHAGGAYILGLQFHWISFSIVLFHFLYMTFLAAPRMRNFAGNNDVMTVADFLGKRFIKMENVIRLLASFIIVVFLIPYMIAQYKGMSFTVQNVLGWDFGTAVIISGIVVMLYTIIGGYHAVIATDVAQGIMMMICQLVVPIAAILAVGGLTPAIEALQGIDPNMIPPISNNGPLYAIGMLFGSIAVIGNPHIITRYISVKNQKEIRKAGLTTLIFNSIVAYGAVIVGFFGRVLFPIPGDLPMGNTEFTYFVVAERLVGNPIVMGLIYAAIFAAIMSTVDSMLLVISSTLVNDVWCKLVKKGQVIKQDVCLKLTRIIVVVVAVLVMFLTFNAPGPILQIALFAWAGVGCSIGAPLLLSLWWPRMTSWGAIAGMVGGTTFVIWWRFIFLGNRIMYEALPGFVVTLLISVAVSLLTKEEENIAAFNDMTKVADDEIDIPNLSSPESGGSIPANPIANPIANTADSST